MIFAALIIFRLRAATFFAVLVSQFFRFKFLSTGIKIILVQIFTKVNSKNVYYVTLSEPFMIMSQ